jgi:glutaredoxin 3
MLDLKLNRSHFEAMKMHVEIYTKFTCGFCARAKQLLDTKNVEYTEYDITLGGPKRAEMEERVPGSKTVPQILINGTPLGGCDDLFALDRSGQLDAMLAGKATQ